eukprot:Nk52_evm18s136 gene=Nk52_evmTU18s136
MGSNVLSRSLSAKKIVYFLPGNGFSGMVYAQFLSNLSTCLNSGFGFVPKTEEENQGQFEMSKDHFFSHPHMLINGHSFHVQGDGGDDWEYELYCVDRLGHEPEYPIVDNWEKTPEEVIRNIEDVQRYHSEIYDCSKVKIIGIGHSFGGGMIATCALRRPDLFSDIFLLDSALTVNPFKSAIAYALKATGLLTAVIKQGGGKGRKTEWDSVEDARKYIKSKKIFEEFPDAVVDDYIRHGMQVVEEKGSLGLKFDPKVEHRVFATYPSYFKEHAMLLARRIYETFALISSSPHDGRDEDIFKHGVVNAHNIVATTQTQLTELDARFLRLMYGVPYTKFHNRGHLFPLTHPSETAALISKIFFQQQKGGD